MRAALEANLAQAQYCYDRAAGHPELEVLPFRPTLSIVPIRQRLDECTDLDAHNLRLASAIQADGSSYVSPANIDGEQWLRPCFTNIRTTFSDVDAFIDSVACIGRAICSEH
jgi:aromatic-L-amino-acid decarboxylase